MVEFYGPAKLNSRVALPCLPKKGEYPAPGKKCVVAGWGYTKYPGGVYHTLQQAELPVVKSPHKGCHNNKEAVCVGYGHGKMSDGKQYPNGCRGDSGGPLVCRRSDGRYQWEGVLSFVYSYCHSYTAYTPVNQYIDWIQSFITSKN
ncbi:chymotrypsin-like elastase family member 2A [Clytia hemisphaerica]